MRIKDVVKNIGWELLKQLDISFSDGKILSGRGYTPNNSFFSELSYSTSEAGQSVTLDKALNYAAYWRCVNILSGTVASLPCHTMMLSDGKRNKAIEHNLYWLLHDEPNPEMDSFNYFESMMYHLCACSGNAYSYIDWDSDMLKVEHLWLMDPSKVQKWRNEAGEIVYLYQFKDGQRTLPAHRVWHVAGFGYDGLKGYTPLTYSKNQIGLALAIEKMGSKLFSNGLIIGGFLKHPGRMSPEAQDRFWKTIKSTHEGVDKAHKLMILEEGMTYDKNNISPEDAQMLDTQKFSKNEMATRFGIPPHKIGDLDRATFSNIEEQNLQFAIDTIRPWVTRIEKSGQRQLLLPDEKKNIYIKFSMDAILRGDLESRYRAHAIGINWGFLNRDEVRELEDRNPIPDGKGEEFMVPANMLPASEFESTLPSRPARAENRTND